MSNMNRRVRGAILMAVIVIVANGVGVYLSVTLNSNGPLGLAVGVTAVTAFVGMLVLSQAPTGPWRITEAAMRTAIAGSLLAQYEALVAMVVFNSRAPETMTPVAQTLVTSFTTIVGVVMAFYFGASAYVEGRRVDRKTAKRPPRSSRPADESDDSPTT